MQSCIAGRPLTAEKLLTEPTGGFSNISVQVIAATCSNFLLLILLYSTAEVRVIEVLLMEESSEFMKIDESKFEYDWVIGIPSIQFRHMLEHAEAHHFGTYILIIYSLFTFFNFMRRPYAVSFDAMSSWMRTV